MFRYFRKSMVAVCLIAAAAAVMLMPAPATAQILYGSLTGTVTDQQKAAMPGVTVTAINTGTNVSTEAVTDGNGNYTIRNLLPGIYDVTAVLQGFREIRQRGLNIPANNIVRADLVLQLGQLSETVNVVAESTLLQTEKADLNTEISSKAVTNLPLNQYRNYQSLLNLVPGATPTQFQNAEIDTPGRSLRTWVNGVQPNANTTRVDGAVSVNVWLPHHAMYVESAEAIDTVNIATNNFDADTGMAAGAAQTVITKSGTNQMKGSAFYFLNNDALTAISYYNDYFDLPENRIKQQTFGGTFGGPIMKNKLFYFFSYEGYYNTRPTQVNYVVPTAKMRAG
ncbi:MAG: carboxypeptidase-like regulatory domain-containing protein, partial [Rhodospirillaceae bacterium]